MVYAYLAHRALILEEVRLRQCHRQLQCRLCCTKSQWTFRTNKKSPPPHFQAQTKSDTYRSNRTQPPLEKRRSRRFFRSKSEMMNSELRSMLHSYYKLCHSQPTHARHLNGFAVLFLDADCYAGPWAILTPCCNQQPATKGKDCDWDCRAKAPGPSHSRQ